MWHLLLPKCRSLDCRRWLLYTFGKPLVLGFFVGLVLGDPVQGTIVGATIQLIYLGVMSTGGSYPADPALAGIVGTAAAISGGLSAPEAVAIAIPVGLAGTVLFNLRMLSAVPFTHMADKAAEKGDTKGVFLANVVGAQVALAAIYVIPCTIICMFGVDAISGLINALAGTTFIRVLGVVGGVLSVVGIAMNMKAIFKGDAIPFFFIGFLMVVYFSLNMLSLSCFALLFAAVYANLKEGGLAAPAIAEGDDDDE